MSARTTSAALAACALLCSPWSARAQETAHCGETDTVDTCADKISGRQPQAAQAAISKTLAMFNTGDSATSTITDFLPWLRLLFDNGTESGETAQKIGIEYSNPLHLNPSHQNKLSLVLEKSEIYAPLKDALLGASLGDTASKLEDGIDQGDDVHATFSYSYASATMGRDPDLHDRLLGGILHEMAEQQSRETKEAARLARERFIGDNRLEDFLETSGGAQLPFGNVPPDKRARYIELTETWLRAESDSVRDLARRLTDANFYRLLELVNNQPQVVASVEYRQRDETVGPDELTASASLEIGGPNINAFRRSAKGCETLKCLSDYLNDPQVRGELESGSVHFKFAAEYSKLQRFRFSMPDPAFDYSEKAVEHLSVSAGLGRYFGSPVSDGRRARLDAKLSYEDFSDDPMRQDRGLANVTVTYPVSGGLFLSVGAVYATRPEFRGDVDHEISARAGFTYKIVEDGK